MRGNQRPLAALEPSAISRRRLLQGSALGAIAAALGSVLGGCGEAQAVEATLPVTEEPAETVTPAAPAQTVVPTRAPTEPVATVTDGKELPASRDGDQLLRAEVERNSFDLVASEPAAAAANALAVDLYTQLIEGDTNLVFSPYSVAIALAMTRIGAVGETAAQMDFVLHAELAGDLNAGFNALDQTLATRSGERPRDDGSVATIELDTANSIWGQAGFSFRDAFLQALAADYGAGMRVVDYVADTEAARGAINAWVAEQTRDRIPELIPTGVLDQLTRLVLTNAIYFKAPWQSRFFEEQTAEAPFHRLDGSEVSAPFMAQRTRFRYASGAGYQAVELPYEGRELAMAVIVPDAGSFGEFERRLTAERLAEVLAKLEPAEIQLRFPRFEFRTQASLSEVLSALGMPIAFTAAADFSGMSEQGKDLLISEVVHEAFIAVDEEGTEAAAATAVAVSVEALPPEPIKLTVDRPFVFLIRDVELGVVLFLGRVVDPTA